MARNYSRRLQVAVLIISLLSPGLVACSSASPPQSDAASSPSSVTSTAQTTPPTASQGSVALEKNEAVILNDVYSRAKDLSIPDFLKLSLSDRINYATVEYGLIEPWVDDQISLDPTVPAYLKPATAYVPWGATNSESTQDVVRRVQKLRIIVDKIAQAGRLKPELLGPEAAKKVLLAYTPWSHLGEIDEVFITHLIGVAGVPTLENDLKAIDAGHDLLRIELDASYANKAAMAAFEASALGHCIFVKDPNSGKDVQVANLQLPIATVDQSGKKHLSWVTFYWLNPNIPKAKADLWEGMWRTGEVETDIRKYDNSYFLTYLNAATGSYSCPTG